MKCAFFHTRQSESDLSHRIEIYGFPRHRCALYSLNEPKISDAYRERALIGG
jgi:hypothetical protein